MIAPGLRAAAAWSLAQTTLRLLLGFANIKVTAVILGPVGLALVGQLSNLISLVSGVLANAIQTAVVKGTAREQAAGNPMPLDLWGTAARWLTGLALATACVAVVAGEWLSRWLFDSDDFGWVIAVAAAALPLALLFNWIQGVLTGLKDFRLVAVSQMVSGVVGVAIFIFLTYYFGLAGALAGTALTAAAAFVVALCCTQVAGLPQVAQSLRLWRPGLLRPMLGHYPMLLVHSAAVPLAALLVRSALIDHVGAEEAGLWQAATRLSDNYTLVVTSILSMYVVPTLAGVRDAARFRLIVYRMALAAAVLVAVMASFVYVWRELIIKILLTSAFRPVGDLLGWMLLGDVFRMATWPLRSALVVQDRRLTYMLVETCATVIQVSATYLLLSAHGLRSAPLAYCGTWLVVLVAVAALHVRPAMSSQ